MCYFLFFLHADKHTLYIYLVRLPACQVWHLSEGCVNQRGAAASMRTSAWEQPSLSPMRSDTRKLQTTLHPGKPLRRCDWSVWTLWEEFVKVLLGQIGYFGWILKKAWYFLYSIFSLTPQVNLTNHSFAILHRLNQEISPLYCRGPSLAWSALKCDEKWIWFP